MHWPSKLFKKYITIWWFWYCYKTDTIFINSENCKTYEPHRLLFNLLDKINLKRSDKYVALSREYYLEILTPKTMKLLGSTEYKITKNENGANVPHLEFTEVVLIYCDIANEDYQHDSRVLYKFVHNKSFGQLLDITPKMLYF